MKGTGFARFLSVLLVALLVFSMLPIRAQADDEQGTDGEETTVVTDAPASKSTAAPTPTGIPEPTATPESTVTPTPDGTPEASTGTGPTATPESTATPELTPTPASSGEPGTGEEQLEENPALFAVTFVDYDGTPIGEAQFVKAGEDAVEPAAPVRDGFTFTGWEPADTTNIQADTVFTAQYAEDTGLDEGLLDIGAGFFASAFGAALMEPMAVTTTYSIQYVRGCGDNGQPKKRSHTTVHR